LSQTYIATDNEYNSQKPVLRFNSIHFNGYFVLCRLNGTSADYKTSTKAQIQQKRVQIIKKQNGKKNNVTRKGAKNLNSGKNNFI